MPFDLDAPPAGSWHEDLPTEPTAPPLLDRALLAGAERELRAAISATETGHPHTAIVHAREAAERLMMALAKHGRRSLLERLVDDTEPLLSGERDVRATEAP
jgi:hypothetical protein